MYIAKNYRSYERSEFVKEYAKKNKCSISHVYKLIKFKNLKVK